MGKDMAIGCKARIVGRGPRIARSERIADEEHFAPGHKRIAFGVFIVIPRGVEHKSAPVKTDETGRVFRAVRRGDQECLPLFSNVTRVTFTRLSESPLGIRGRKKAASRKNPRDREGINFAQMPNCLSMG